MFLEGEIQVPKWVSRIKVPIPIESLKFVNVYLIREDNTFSLIDAGMYSIRSFHELINRVASIGLRIGDLESIVVTHFHVDHITLSPILYELSGADFYLGLKDESTLRKGFDKFIGKALRLYKRHGVPQGEANEISRYHPAMRIIDVYDNYLREMPWIPLTERSEVELGSKRFKVIHVPGHTPGQINLFYEEEGILFAGDHILDRITPQITLIDEREDPLGDYMNSLEKVSMMNARIALPGHGEPIVNPSKRAKELIEHHKQRLNEILGYVKERGEATAYELAKVVRWRTNYSSWEEYPYPERFFAIGETLSHLRRLELENKIEKRERAGIVKWVPLV